MISFRYIPAFIVTLLLIQGVSASYISLATTVSVDKTQIFVRLKNNGDETAHQVHLSLLLPEGFHANELSPGNIDPDGEYEGNFNVEVPRESLPGSYSFAILTSYRDANGYPFSSVTPGTLNIEKSSNSRVFGAISSTQVSESKSGKVKLKVRNLDDKEHSIRIRLFMPQELSSDLGEREISIKGREEDELEFTVSNFGALPGSNYVIFASLEYEDSSHYTAVAPGMINVVESVEGEADISPGDLGSVFWILIGSLLLLLAIFVYYQIR